MYSINLNKLAAIVIYGMLVLTAKPWSDRKWISEISSHTGEANKAY